MGSTITVTLDGGSRAATVGVTQPASQAAARFARVSYAATPPPPPGRYTMLDVGYQIGRTGVSAIKAADPAVKVLCYCAIDILDSLNGQVGAMNPGTQYAEAEYLHSALPIAPANRIVSGTRTRMDLTYPAWQARVAAWITQRVTTGGYDGIFQDGVDLVRAYGSPQMPTPTYTSMGAITTDAQWQAAEASMLTVTAAAMHSLGKLLVANIGGGLVYPLAWQQMMTLPDAAMDETWTVGTNGVAFSLTQWKQGLLNVQWAEANGKPLWLNGDMKGNLTLAQYALCSMLLVTQGQMMWDTSLGAYGSGENWLAFYDRALSLGAPLGAYTVSGGLYSRLFQGGIVTVDPVNHIGTVA